MQQRIYVCPYAHPHAIHDLTTVTGDSPRHRAALVTFSSKQPINPQPCRTLAALAEAAADRQATARGGPVAPIIQAMGLTRVHLVGHSQESWPVTRIALDHPEQVASLTLVDGTMVAPSRDAGSAIRFYLYLSQDLHPPGGETVESARRGMELFSYTHNNLTEQRVERLVAMTRQPIRSVASLVRQERHEPGASQLSGTEGADFGRS